jgi:DNA-binding MarR family transcriptional regulator
MPPLRPSVDVYVGMTRLIERMHRRYLDVIKVELTRLGLNQINPVQMMLLTDLEEEISVRDLTRRTYHLGSSISYNLKMLAEQGLIDQSPAPHDKRSVRLKLTEKGRAVTAQAKALLAEHADKFCPDEASRIEFEQVCRLLRRLEQSWSELAWQDRADDF